MNLHLSYLLKTFYALNYRNDAELTAPKLESIVPIIDAVGASVICLFPYFRLF